MKKYVVTVPIKATQRVLVQADSAEEAKEKVLRAEIDSELGEMQFQEVDPDGPWEVEQQHEIIRVDLKWSLWSKDKDFWDERAPGAWDELANLAPQCGVVIKTAPKKEIRYGTVTVERQQDGWVARGVFSACWDDVESLGDTLNVPEEELEALSEVVPRTMDGEIGLDIDFDVSATTLEELMSKLDECEAQLLENETQAWEAFEHAYRVKEEPNEP